MRIEPLDDAEHLLLTTFEADGTPTGEAVRFAGTAGRFVLIVAADDEIVGRVSANGRAEVAASTPRGRVVPGAAILAASARILDDQIDEIEKLLRKKYGLRWLSARAGQGLYRRARSLDDPDVVALEVTLNEAI